MSEYCITNRLITPPATFPLALGDARAWLKVTWSDEDDLIQSLIETATQAAEQSMRKVVLIDQVWEQYYDFMPSEFVLNKWPVSAVNSITYLDSSGSAIVLDPSLYILDSDSSPAKIIPALDSIWPSALETNKAVTVNFNAGYASASAVPKSIISAIQLILLNLWENRPLLDGDLVPKAARHLLQNQRAW